MMSIPPPPGQHPAAMDPNASSTPDASPADRQRLGPVIIALMIGCCVMLVATIALGATSASLFASSIPSPTPTPTPSPTKTEEVPTQTVRGLEIVVRSDVEFGDFAIGDPDASGLTLVVAPISWKDKTSAIYAQFDITAYDEDGRIIGRHPNQAYLLPGQEGFFRGILAEDLSDAVRITVEQVGADIEAPMMSGAIALNGTETLVRDGKSYVGGNLTSTLSAVPQYPEVFLAGYVDGELFSVCWDSPDIPAGGDFVAICELIPVTSDEKPLTKIPKDAEFRAYLALERL